MFNNIWLFEAKDFCIVLLFETCVIHIIALVLHFLHVNTAIQHIYVTYHVPWWWIDSKWSWFSRSSQIVGRDGKKNWLLHLGIKRKGTAISERRQDQSCRGRQGKLHSHRDLHSRRRVKRSTGRVWKKE